MATSPIDDVADAGRLLLDYLVSLVVKMSDL